MPTLYYRQNRQKPLLSVLSVPQGIMFQKIRWRKTLLPTTGVTSYMRGLGCVTRLLKWCPVTDQEGLAQFPFCEVIKTLDLRLEQGSGAFARGLGFFESLWHPGIPLLLRFGEHAPLGQHADMMGIRTWRSSATITRKNLAPEPFVEPMPTKPHRCGNGVVRTLTVQRGLRPIGPPNARRCGAMLPAGERIGIGLQPWGTRKGVPSAAPLIFWRGGKGPFPATQLARWPMLAHHHVAPCVELARPRPRGWREMVRIHAQHLLTP